MTSDQALCVHAGAVPGGAVVNRVRIDRLSPEELLLAIEGFLECRRAHVVHFFAAHSTVLARRDESYRAIANGGDLNFADGSSVAVALRLLGAPTRRITGSDALELVCRWGISRQLRHFLYGGPPTERLRTELEATYPGIQIVDAVDARSPPSRPLSDAELEQAAERMRLAGADVVWVGLGTPKQDYTADRLRALDAAPVIMCVGAVFDFASGLKARAPRWMRRLGIEWLHRIVTEPRRLGGRYLIGNPQFVAGVLTDLVRGRRVLER